MQFTYQCLSFCSYFPFWIEFGCRTGKIFGMPNIHVTTASQDHITLTLGDLLSNLKWMTMLDFGARKDKWSFNADVIYLHIGDHIQDTGW